MRESSKPAVFSIASILSIAAAIGSFMTGAVLGLVLAVLAIVLGLIGVLLSFSASRRGGIISILAVLGGFIGIIAAVIKAIMWLF